ncbi:MAG TPA: TssN family type VI secretion system protein [Chitinophagaceae bacterium]|jgi:hypothetical protein|nr:TssN family type VI secretion system protein [Chitinophagaceae bacterium]
MAKSFVPISPIAGKQNLAGYFGVKFKYVAVFLLSSLAMASLLFASLHLGISEGWMKLTQMLLFSFFGYVHLRKLNKYVRFTRNSFADRMNFSIQLAILICLVLIALYLFLGHNFLLLALGSGSAFLLPFVVVEAWSAFTSKSRMEYGVWHKPVPEDQEKVYIFFTGFSVQFKFSLSADDSKKQVYSTQAPLDRSLGEFFNHFLLIKRNNNKSRIELMDEHKQPFGWKFYLLSNYGIEKRLLDPDLDLKQNNVPQNAVIQVERVQLIK